MTDRKNRSTNAFWILKSSVLVHQSSVLPTLQSSIGPDLVFDNAGGRRQTDPRLIPSDGLRPSPPFLVSYFEATDESTRKLRAGLRSCPVDVGRAGRGRGISQGLSALARWRARARRGATRSSMSPRSPVSPCAGGESHGRFGRGLSRRRLRRSRDRPRREADRRVAERLGRRGVRPQVSSRSALPSSGDAPGRRPGDSHGPAPGEGMEPRPANASPSWDFPPEDISPRPPATHFDAGKPDAADPIERESSRPDRMILVYPVIAMATAYGHAGSKRNLLGDNPPANSSRASRTRRR